MPVSDNRQENHLIEQQQQQQLERASAAVSQLRRLEEKLGCSVYGAQDLTRVTHVLDLDGFILGKKFYPKEVCLLELGRDIAWRADVLLPVAYRSLSPSEQTSVSYVTHKVHGMFWNNYGPMQRKDLRRCFLRDLASVDTAIKASLDRWRRNEDRTNDSLLNYSPAGSVRTREPFVAYKGGSIERNLLSRIGVDSVDLHYYGCPKFDYLVQKNEVSEYKNLSRTSAPLTHLNRRCDTDFVCDLHSSRKRTTVWHCPVVECRVFGQWIKLAIQSWRVRESIDKATSAATD